MLFLKPLLTTLVEQNPEEMGDLYLDVAEAFLDVGEYNSALPLLSSLVCSERYNLAVVWLRHAGEKREHWTRGTERWQYNAERFQGPLAKINGILHSPVES